MLKKALHIILVLALMLLNINPAAASYLPLTRNVNIGIGTSQAVSGRLVVMGGNVGIGTLTPQGGFVVTNGNVGLGTWAPIQRLHVEGQCVTGDTRLRRRRRRADGAYDYDEVRIDAITPGDEILSLNEQTGLLEYQKVNALMDMGVKDIYKLTTASGKTIRTTGNHPYFVKNESSILGQLWTKLTTKNVNKPSYWTFIDEVGTGRDQAQPYFAVGALTIKLPEPAIFALNQQLRAVYMDAIASLKADERRFEFKFKSVTTSSLPYYLKLLKIFEQSIDDIDFSCVFASPQRKQWEQYMGMIKQVLNKNYKHVILTDFLIKPKAAKQNLGNLQDGILVEKILQVEAQGTLFVQVADIFVGALNFMAMGKVDEQKLEVAKAVLRLIKKIESRTDTDSVCAVPNPRFDSNIADFVSSVKGINKEGAASRLYPQCGGMVTDSTAIPKEGNGSWVKVSDIKEGSCIATLSSSDVSLRGGEADEAIFYGHAHFERIISIELLPPEQVWDVEIANTHNFVGNDIIAHNTYLNGNLGIGTSDAQGGLVVTNGNVGVGTWSPRGIIEISQSRPTSPFIIDTNGNVGMGTTRTTTAGLSVMTGNVGIGTWKPTVDLQVVGGTTTTVQVNGATANRYAQLWFNDAAATGGTNTSGTQVLQVAGGGEFIISSSIVYVVDNLFGVGLTTPVSKLAVLGNVGIGTVSYSSYLTTAAPNGGMILEGNVGIGSITPGQALDVTGTVRATAFVGDGSGLTSVSNTAGFTDGGTEIYTTIATDNVGIGTVAYSGTKLAVMGGNVGIGTNTAQGALVVTNGNVGLGTWAPVQTLHVNGQCVTGDTRLRRRRKRADGTYDYDECRIDAITPGDEILSLNEQTGRLEYQRVNALMDMGVKDIYRLTTASGKTIRTTGNHPYLVRVEVPRWSGSYSSSEIESSQIRNVFARMLLGGCRSKNSDNADLNFANVGGCNLNINMPGYSDGGNLSVIAKSLSLVRRVLLDFWQICARDLSEDRLSARLTSYPSVNNHLMTSRRKFSSARKCMGFGVQGNEMSLLGHDGSVVQSGFDMVERQGGIGVFDDFLRCFSGCKKFKDQIDHNTGTFEARFAETDVRIGGDVFTNVHDESIACEEGLSTTNLWIRAEELKSGDFIAVMNSLPPCGEACPAKGGGKGGSSIFERITSIELLPPEQVWDVEIANTHNFVGNDIIAHNTYLNGNLGIGTSDAQGGLVVTNGNVGVGTWSPRGVFEVSQSQPTSPFIIDTNGNVGIGTTRTATSGLTVMNGNVGIGTWVPNRLLDIKGTAAISGQLNFDASGNYNIQQTNNSLYLRGVAITLNPSGIQRMIVDSTGNVGIGTSLQVAGLAVMNGNVGIGTWKPVARLGIVGNVGIGTLGNGLYLTSTPPEGGMIVEGNVGIGSAAPGQALDVTGTVRATAFVGDGSGLTSVSNSAGFTDGTNVVYTTVGADNVGIGTHNPLSKLVVAGGGVGIGTNMNSAFIQTTAPNGGLLIENNVGIGTLIPTKKLEVMGNVGIGTTSDKYSLVVNNAISFRSEYDEGSEAGAFTIDWNSGNKQKVTLTGSTAHTATFTAPTTGVSSIMLKVVQGDASNTITWPGTVKWPASTAPTLSTSANDIDIISCYWDGTNYFCQGSLDFGA